MKYYHSSPDRLKVGTILTGRRKANDSLDQAVFLTTDPVPHYTIIERAIKEDWHIYEVEPMGKITHGGMWDELTAPQAEVVRYVGKARGIGVGKRGSGVFPKIWLNADWTRPQTPFDVYRRAKRIESEPIAQEYIEFYKKWAFYIERRIIPPEVQEKLERLIEKVNKRYYQKI